MTHYRFFRIGVLASSGYDIAFSLALVGAGHLVGLSVGMAMLTGLVIAWAIAVPILTSMQPAADGVSLAAHTITIWRTQVRFIGAGAIAVAALFTLAKFAKPVVGGLVSTLASSRYEGERDDFDRDLSPRWILTHYCMPPHHRMACLLVRAVYGRPCAKRLEAYAYRRTVRAVRRFSHRRNLRLHGRIDRRFKQSDLGRRHSVDRAMRISTHLRCVADNGDPARTRRLRSLRDGDRLCLRDDLER